MPSPILGPALNFSRRLWHRLKPRLNESAAVRHHVGRVQVGGGDGTVPYRGLKPAKNGREHATGLAGIELLRKLQRRTERGFDTHHRLEVEADRNLFVVCQRDGDSVGK